VAKSVQFDEEKFSMSKSTTSLRLLAAGVLLTWSGLALAQYVWLDEKGTKQFSDRPPPPNVPDSRILKSPAGGFQALEQAAPPAPAQGASELERKAAERKRAEKEEKEKQKKATATANCEIARQNKQTYSSSAVRVAKIGKNGEVGYMDAQELRKALDDVNKVLDGCE
jgi:hypothetical protein